MSFGVCQAERPDFCLAFAAMVVTFTIGHPGFLSPANLINVFAQSSVLLLVALPMTLVIMTEGLDLSVGAILSLASVALALASVATEYPDSPPSS